LKTDNHSLGTDIAVLPKTSISNTIFPCSLTTALRTLNFTFSCHAAFLHLSDNYQIPEAKKRGVAGDVSTILDKCARAYRAFTSELDPLFFLFLSGQALTVYGVIAPAEIRDYFRDKSMGIQTMTVKLGLVNASIFSIMLLSIGGILAGTGLSLKLLYGSQPMLIVSMFVVAVVYGFILRKYKRLYSLSKKYIALENSGFDAQEIENLSAQNPKWITAITQTIVFMCIVLLVSKIFS
jgi:hypothetical protein